MPRIGATISGLEQCFLKQLAQADSAVLDSAVRLTTRKQFTGPSDNPSAFIEIGQFERRLSVVEDTKRNVDVAASIGAQSQLVIDEIRTHLETIRDSLELDVDGSLTDDERTAQQAEIDSAVESINELAKTDINGKRYLDGSVNYRFSGKDSSEISGIEVHSLRETVFAGTVTSAATQAAVTYTGAAGAITADATFTLTGKRGSSVVSVTSGQTLAAAADLINQVSHETGVSAVAAGDDLTLTTVDYGDSATIALDVELRFIQHHRHQPRGRRRRYHKW
jgi:flagellin-like hook-associated protein FlgL